MILTEKFKLINILRRVLQSWLLVPFIFCCGAIFWFFSLSYMTVAIFALFAILILLFCSNINNFFALLFYVSFFIKNIDDKNTPWLVYIICIGLAVVLLIAYFVKMCILEKDKVNKGTMWIAIIISTIAFLLGGVIGHFDIINALIILGFSVATFIIYILARNKTVRLDKYLAYLFTVGALFLTLVILVGRLRLVGTIFISKPEGELFFFSAQELNTASIYITLGIVGCYRLGRKTKYDIAYFALAILLFLSVVLTCCRITTLVSFMVLIAVYVLLIVDSENKKRFLWFTLVCVVIVSLLSVIFREYIYSLFEMLLEKLQSGLNGRDQLWPWCFDRFLENPIFGMGFVSDTPVPSLREFTTIVLAHNTVLQWLTSLGVIGTLLMGYFYFKKYTTIFKKFSKSKVFCLLAVLVIEVVGMLDQAPAMDTFTYILPLVLIASCESFNEKSGQVLKE